MSFEPSEVDGNNVVRDPAPHSAAPFEISARATRNEHPRGCGCDRIAYAEQRLPFMHHLEKTQAAKLVDWVGARS